MRDHLDLQCTHILICDLFVKPSPSWTRHCDWVQPWNTSTGTIKAFVCSFQSMPHRRSRQALSFKHCRDLAEMQTLTKQTFISCFWELNAELQLWCSTQVKCSKRAVKGPQTCDVLCDLMLYADRCIYLAESLQVEPLKSLLFQQKVCP